ncbi:MAG: metallophosphoesterase [Planctomycetota bacterium]
MTRQCVVAVMAVLLYATGSVGAQELTRGPFLQLGSTDSMVIVWRTATPSAGAVEYGLDAGLGLRVESRGPSIEHAVALTGLSAGTEYHYRVLSGGVVTADGLRFRTFPDPASAGQYRVVVVGDTGTGNQAQLDVAAGIRLSAPDVGIHTGDFIYPRGGSDLEMDRKYFGIYAETISRSVIYPTVGNHDLDDGGTVFFGSFHLPEDSPGGERYYSFEYGDALFLILDSNQGMGVGTAQYAWIEEQLAGSRKLWKIASLHHPLYAAWLAVEANRRALDPLFARYGVDLVFQAHAHFYERFYPMRNAQAVATGEDPDYQDPDAPIYVVSGGGGGSLAQRNPGANTAYYASVYHHVRLDFQGSRLLLSAVGRDNRVFDSMSISKVVAPVFKRGDTDGDGEILITDAVRILNYLFLGGDLISCPEAANFDNSESVDISDGIHVLNYLFRGGPPPAPPGPPPGGCGPDPDPAGGAGDLGCGEYSGC